MHGSQGLADDGDPGRLVATTAVAFGCQERGIRLDQNTLDGKGRSHFSQVSGLLEGDDARERHDEAVIERAVSELLGSGVAVEHTLHVAGAFLDPDVEQFVVGFRPVTAHVDRDRKVDLPRERDLLGEDTPLRLPRRVHVVVVESAFSDRHDLRLRQPLPLQAAAGVVELVCVVGMHACRREDVLAVAREFDGGARALDAVARADGDQGLDARLAGTLQHVFAVCVEAVRGDVAMAVEPHR